jgi:hypothetical protein
MARKSILPAYTLAIALLLAFSQAAARREPEPPYNFRQSTAYRNLSKSDRAKLETVHRDLVLLWGALDMYADYEAQVPPTLDALEPYYLLEIPTDPFADSNTAAEKDIHGYIPSRKGWGYRYRLALPNHRAWILASVGLPKFPYLAPHGNYGLHVAKGTWAGAYVATESAVIKSSKIEGWPYKFRNSEAYERLPKSDKAKLETVHRDLILLWGALDMYADHNYGEPPETLDQLVPAYLAELPKDPFADANTAADPNLHHAAPSANGWGYRYKPGARGNRAWCISSVGLPNFPYLAPRGNFGLYQCKGTWISGENPVVLKNPH